MKHNTLLPGTHHSLSFTLTRVCVCVRGGAPRLCAGTVETLVLVQKGPARLLLIPDLHVPTRASSLTSCPPLSHPTPEQRKHTHTHTPSPLSVCLSRLHKNVHSGVSSRSPQQHAASWFQPSLISASLQKKPPTFSSLDVLSLWSLLLLFVNTSKEVRANQRAQGRILIGWIHRSNMVARLCVTLPPLTFI